MENTKQKNSRIKIITHSGRFHTDDVFACAALSILHDGNVEIVRSRDPKVCETGDFVVDVGGIYDKETNRFDHHQEGGAGGRPNGILYSSFGLVWKHYGELIAGSSATAEAIDKRLVQPIDAGDNGIDIFSSSGEVSPYLIQDVVTTFAPAWNEERTDDEGFFEVLEIAIRVLARYIHRTQNISLGMHYVEEAYEHADDKRIVILDGPYPWHEVLSRHSEPLYVINPDRGIAGNWKAEAIRSDLRTFKNRKNFPREWAGKQGKELADISGVPDAVFCHNNCFIVAAQSKVGAIKLAELAADR